MVKMRPVKGSSSIRAVGYDRRTAELWIEYRSSPRFYACLGVPPRVFAELQQADSKGRYVNRVVKRRYPYEDRSRAGGARRRNDAIRG